MDFCTESLIVGLATGGIVASAFFLAFMNQRKIIDLLEREVELQSEMRSREHERMMKWREAYFDTVLRNAKNLIDKIEKQVN